ncbi:MAG: hypothetical protein LWY06_03255 [Firmicutes bacterium]|nr:hypothetical protein [Bacillota bacterium]
MKKCILTVLMFLIAACSQVWADDVLVIRKGDLEYRMGYIRKDHVKLSNLQKIFEFRIETGTDTGAVKINGFQYREGVIFYQGTYYVSAEGFLKYFLAEFSQDKSKALVVQSSGLFDEKSFTPKKMEFKPSYMSAWTEISVLAGRQGVFAELGTISKFLRKKMIYNPASGYLSLDGKQIKRALLYDNRIFALQPDIEKAIGYSLEFSDYKKAEESPEESKQAKYETSVRENVKITYTNQLQYGTLSPTSPIGYQFFVNIDNRFKHKIELSPDCFLLTDTNGNTYYGNIMQASGYIPTNTTSRESIIKNSGVYLNYYTIQSKDDADIVVEFFPDANTEPGFFIVRYNGVELMRVKVTRTYIP